MLLIDAGELDRIGRRVFAAAGSAESEAEIVAGHLLEANLKGHDSHGVGMIPSYLRNLEGGKVKPNEPGHIASDTGALVVYEGARGYGQIVARNATELAIARAKTNGVAVVALKNAHHIGRVGTYGELCAAAGLVSLHFVNITDQRPAVAPWRGSDGRFGTNPLCIALPGPAPDRPIIADMATSRIAMGKVRVARNKGEQVTAGTLLDSEGKPTTDPHVMYRRPRGALMTFADTLGALCAFLNLPPGAGTSTIESKTNFFRAVREGQVVHARSFPLHTGRTVIVVQTDLGDGNGKRVAQVVQTQAVLPPR